MVYKGTFKKKKKMRTHLIIEDWILGTKHPSREAKQIRSSW